MKKKLFSAALISETKQHGFEYVESVCAVAEPAGPVEQAVYESFRDEILQDLQKSMPVDAILLNLHGSMVAEGYPDCEGDLLGRVRKIVGEAVPIAVELDLHTCLTSAMLDNATILLSYKEYPHTDVAVVAAQLFQLLQRILAKEVKPVMRYFDCCMINSYSTLRGPMREFVDKIKSLETQDSEVLAISVIHGFPWTLILRLNSGFSY